MTALRRQKMNKFSVGFLVGTISASIIIFATVELLQ